MVSVLLENVFRQQKSKSDFMIVYVIASSYPTTKYPLSGIFEFDQAKALKKAGCKVVLLSVDLRSLRRMRRWGKYHIVKEGIEVYNISIPLGRVPGRIYYEIGYRALLSLYKWVVREQGRPDIVHAHFTGMGAISTVLKRKYNIPLVMTEHSSGLNTDCVNKKDLFMARLAYDDVNRLITVSSSLQYHIKQNLGKDSIVIPNIVDTDNIISAPQSHKKFTFISIGNLIHGKGFDLLIKAFNVFKGQRIQLLIIGEGKERPELESLIKSLKLEEQVFLLGLKNRREVSDYLNQSDAFVLASRGETFGVVYIEAMLVGLPVIATKCGGPESFVNENNGLLVNCDDVEELKRALQQMYETYNHFDKKQIAMDCLRKYSPQSVASQLITVYKQILDGKE